MPVPLEDLLRLMIDEEASDLHVSTGVPPVLRLRGSLTPLNLRPLTPEDTEALCHEIGNEHWTQRLNTEGSADFAISFREQRFRVNLYRERGHCAMAVRLLPSRFLSLDEIGVPASIRPLLDLPRGLILVTGPTGSGKSTTLASMLNIINETSPRHILTIEDPIEYLHTHKRGLIHQREVGSDLPTFADGLRRGLRQDPDVILVGEMRDLETMEAAVTAAETGHLVFSTLHTTGAERTVDRLVGAFPAAQQEQIRIQFASTLRAAISQVLVPRADGKGRVAAFEVLLNTLAVAALIRENKSYSLTTVVQTGAEEGMLSLEQSLVNLHAQGLISYEEVMNKAQDRELAAQLAVHQQKHSSQQSSL
ncbi:MAG: type IV pilus twitching motility protein PilT [Chthoniobacteraceae bacterium]|nr:type IV pilus twitching motility protein PilT [Chthoniobacteraceae bacterium]